MTTNLLRGVSGLAALVMSAALVADASACGACGGATTAFYQPTTAYYQPAAYTTAYAPAYTSYYGGSGWYPGYWLDRVSQNIWGTPTTYAVAYPSTYTASYSYAPAYSVGYATAYAAPACSSCSTCTAGYAPCSSCVQTVTMRPVCTTACAPACGCSDCGSTCSSCSGGGCSSCGQAETVVPSGVTQAGGSGSASPPPDLAPDAQVPPREALKLPTDDADKLDPSPADENTPPETPDTDSGATPAEDATKGEPSSTYFEAPKLFIPNDRTASRVAAPVRQALYERPVAARQVSNGRITAAQAQRDAAGWTSASN